jgi:hypothetical protein
VGFLLGLWEIYASLIFDFFPTVVCVFSTKVLAASLSFWIGRSVPFPSISFLSHQGFISSSIAMKGLPYLGDLGF